MRRGLLYCMEYLEESLSDWLGEELQVMREPLHTLWRPKPALM